MSFFWKIARSRLSPVLALVLVLGAHLVVQLRWLRVDQSVALSVCCDLVDPVLGRISAPLSSAGLNPSPWEPSLGLLPELAARFFWLRDGEPEFALELSLLSALVAQVLLFLIGARLSGAWVGVLASALLPLIPAMLFLERRWDVFGPAMPLLLAAFLMVILSRGFTRLLPSIGFGLVGWACAWLSPRATDNLLFLLAIGAFAGAALLRTWVCGRGPLGEPLSRWRSLLLMPAALGLIGYAVRGYFFVDGSFVLRRVMDETRDLSYQETLPRWDLHALLAYPAHLAWEGLTLPLAVMLVVAMALVLRRGAGRAELMAWIWVPTLLLSLVAKKNFYYLAVIYPALPLMLALGAGAIPRPFPRMLGVLALFVASLLSMSGPGKVGAGPGRPMLVEKHKRAFWSGAFQTREQLMLAPQPEPWASRLSQELLPFLKGDPCVCPQVVGSIGFESSQELPFHLARVSPCLQWRALTREARPNPQQRASIAAREASLGYLLVRRGPPAQDALLEGYLGQGFRLTRTLIGENGASLELYTRDEPWYSASCEGGLRRSLTGP